MKQERHAAIRFSDRTKWGTPIMLFSARHLHRGCTRCLSTVDTTIENGRDTVEQAGRGGTTKQERCDHRQRTDRLTADPAGASQGGVFDNTGGHPPMKPSVGWEKVRSCASSIFYLPADRLRSTGSRRVDEKRHM